MKSYLIINTIADFANNQMKTATVWWYYRNWPWWSVKWENVKWSDTNDWPRKGPVNSAVIGLGATFSRGQNKWNPYCYNEQTACRWLLSIFLLKTPLSKKRCCDFFYVQNSCCFFYAYLHLHGIFFETLNTVHIYN